MRLRMIGLVMLCLGGCGVQEIFGREPAEDPQASALIVNPDTSPAPEDVVDEASEDVNAVPSDPVPLPAADPVVEPEIASGSLGRTIASLGNAAEPGLWLKTPLVTTEQPGRVSFDQSGKTVDVTLIPIDGPPTAGSRLSLAAMQALGAPLTGLPEVEVTAG